MTIKIDEGSYLYRAATVPFMFPPENGQEFLFRVICVLSFRFIFLPICAISMLVLIGAVVVDVTDPSVSVGHAFSSDLALRYLMNGIVSALIVGALGGVVFLGIRRLGRSIQVPEERERSYGLYK